MANLLNMLSMCARRLGFTTLTIAALLTGCAGLATPAGKLGSAPGKRLHDAAVAGAAVGPDERLWRLIVADRQIYVDSSEDHGATYSAPVAVSPGRQPILARTEDRPSIAADARGWVYVLYTVGTIEAPITYLVYSMDAGRRFSTPRPITDPAHPSPHYQGAMVIDTEGRLYVFWNDERARDLQRRTGKEHRSILRAMTVRRHRAFRTDGLWTGFAIAAG